MKASRGLLDWGIGIKTTSLSMNAQAASASFMTRLLCQRVSELGRKARVVRIENPPLSLAQSQHLGMDLATPRAIQLLKQLGVTKAQASHEPLRRTGFRRRPNDPPNFYRRLTANP